ncbi:hypothetical protein [Ectobacillus panaciterrae]|uniref:hypothetical protein n=1 Tax=Ectobacillus panaciterrae TaxID=363872 RepID=UPI00040EBA03|nr:hypothetical protein [Ectobacillus panaciterrae]
MMLKTYFLNEMERETYEKEILRRIKGLDEEDVMQLDDKVLIKVHDTCVKEKIGA